MIARLALALLLLLPLAACADGDGPAPMEMARDEIVILTQDGRRLPFTVEMALSPEEQRRGLMYRESLADDAGMLFLYRADAPRRMWMKNTLIPLDMLFIRADGSIESIAQRTEPLSERVIASRGPVRAVLELRGGLTEEVRIRPGDRVLHPWLGRE